MAPHPGGGLPAVSGATVGTSDSDGMFSDVGFGLDASGGGGLGGRRLSEKAHPDRGHRDNFGASRHSRFPGQAGHASNDVDLYGL